MRPEQGTLISRAQAMAALLELLTDQPVIICNGFPSREAQKLVDRPTHFYMIGSMGSAPAIALGVALAKPHTQVITFDGDGNVLMGMGTLATVAAHPRHVLLFAATAGLLLAPLGPATTLAAAAAAAAAVLAAGFVERRPESVQGSPAGGPVLNRGDRPAAVSAPAMASTFVTETALQADARHSACSTGRARPSACGRPWASGPSGSAGAHRRAPPDGCARR